MSEKDNIKVVFFGVYNSGDILTGPEKVCKRIFEEYSRLNKTLFIQYFQDGESYCLFKKLFGYEKTTEIYGNEVLRLGVLRMLYQMIKTNPQVIHILSYNRFTTFLYLLKLFIRVKIYYNLNGIIRHENKYYSNEKLFAVLKNIIAENIIIYTSDRLFYLSDFSKKIMSLYYLPDSARLSKTVNGVDYCFLESGPNQILKSDSNSLVFIGNINQKDKGFDFLFYSVVKCNRDIKLFVVDSSFKKRFIRPEYKDKIIIVNKMVSVELVEFLKDKKVLVSASECDMFNISVLEAISCGVYPIITKQTGVSEIIEKYVSASIIDYGDENSLASIINDVFDNKLHYRLLNDLKLLSWENILKNYYLPYYE